MYLIILHIIMYTVMYYKFELKRKTEKKEWYSWESWGPALAWLDLVDVKLFWYGNLIGGVLTLLCYLYYITENTKVESLDIPFKNNIFVYLVTKQGKKQWLFLFIVFRVHLSCTI